MFSFSHPRLSQRLALPRPDEASKLRDTINDLLATQIDNERSGQSSGNYPSGSV